MLNTLHLLNQRFSLFVESGKSNIIVGYKTMSLINQISGGPIYKFLDTDALVDRCYKILEFIQKFSLAWVYKIFILYNINIAYL